MTPLPSKRLFEAPRIFIGVCDTGMDLVHSFVRMTEVASSFYIFQALRIATGIRIGCSA